MNTHTIFVSRQAELESLNQYLEKMLVCQGQICFISGEAGSGKTTLIGEFTRHAQASNANLLVTLGECDQHTGIGDPYLPFREALNILTGDVDESLAQGDITEENANRITKAFKHTGGLLLDIGPDLIGIFVPWAAIAIKASKMLATRAGLAERFKERLASKKNGEVLVQAPGLNQDQIFEQYINVLRAISEKNPLILVLDDLQWGDASSIELLFRLGRRLEGSRILVLGSLRPEEIALGRAGERHPLDKVINEFKRYYGDIWIDLNSANQSRGREFIDAYLDSEPNRFDEFFRVALWKHTGGHPLFTVELLRDLHEGNDIVKAKDGYWGEQTRFDWKGIPARVEGVINERINRLSPDQRQILSTASVEGEQFTAEVIANVLSLDTRSLIRQLSQELQNEHQLVESQGVNRILQQRLSHYQFFHNVLQNYLYQGLDDVERSYIHEAVGYALEALYGKEAEKIAVQLAWHFESAELSEKARLYLKIVAEQAAASFANKPAVEYYNRVLALTPDEELNERYDLLFARENLFDLLGERENQGSDLHALKEIAAKLDDDRRWAKMMLRMANFAGKIGDPQSVINFTQIIVDIIPVSDSESAQLIVDAYTLWGWALTQSGNNQEATDRYQTALAFARDNGYGMGETRVLQRLGTLKWRQGDLVAASDYLEESLAIADEDGYKRQEWSILNSSGIIAKDQSRFALAAEFYDRALEIVREIGDKMGENILLINQGELHQIECDYARAALFYEDALETAQLIDNRMGQGIVMMNLGDLHNIIGYYDKSKIFSEKALKIMREVGYRMGEDIVLGNLGQNAYARGDYDNARGYAEQALIIAKEIEDRVGEGILLNELGAAHKKTSQPEEAIKAYIQAIAIWVELNRKSEEFDSIIRLASVNPEQSDRPIEAPFDEIIEHLNQQSAPNGRAEPAPMDMYLNLINLLRVNGDPRYESVLVKSHEVLLKKAAKISDEAIKTSFLENVSTHKEILSQFSQLSNPHQEN